MGTILVRQNFFFENWDSYSAEIPADQKFSQNRSISHSFHDFAFLYFPYLENS